MNIADRITRGCLLATLLIIGVIIGNNSPDVKIDLPDYQFPVEIDFGSIELPGPSEGLDTFESPEPPAAPVTPPAVEDEPFVEDPDAGPPEPPEAPQSEPQFDVVRVVMHTADWCAPCRRWKANEESKVNAEVIHTEDPPPQTAAGQVYPTFEIQYHDGNGWVPKVRFGGYVSADSINDQINAVLEKEPV